MTDKQNKKTIGVLECGLPSPKMREKFAGYGEMICQMLVDKTDMKPDDFTLYSICEQEGDALDAMLADADEKCDTYIISGSILSSYSTHIPMVAALHDFIRDGFHDKGKKFVGICFGHQIIARALGGVVEKSDKDWGLGTYQYALSPYSNEKANEKSSGILGAQKNITLYAIHEDQVTVKPEIATLIAGNDFCPYAMLEYGDSNQSDSGYAFTMQPHPEFSKDYVTAEIANSRGTIWSEAMADKALQSLQHHQPDDDLMAQKVAMLLS